MEKQLKSRSIFLKIIMTLAFALALFAYAHLIQRELMTTDNTGKVTIVASKKETKKGDVYYQNISRISINGQSIDLKNLKDNEWTTYNIEVADVFYVANKKASMTIRSPQPVKSLSFEYQKHTGHGILQIYIDDQLIKEIDANAKKFSTDFTTILTPQHIGISQYNIFWYSLLFLFLISSLIFVSKELYTTINRRRIFKFASLALPALASLSIAFDYLDNGNLSLFNSKVGSGEVLTLAFLTLFFIGVSFVTIRAILPSKFKSVLKFPYLFIYLVPPFFAFFLAENAYSSMIILKQEALVYNFIILALIYLALSWITTSLKIGGSLLFILATIFGVLNKVMIDTRNQPLLFYHFLQFKDGLNIAKATSISFDNAILQSIFLAWIGIAVLIFLPKPSYPKPKFLSKYQAKLPSWIQKKYVFRPLLGLTGLVTSLVLLPQLLIFTAQEANIHLNYWTMQATYAKYGGPLSIISFYKDGLITEPKGYSKQAVTDILKDYEKAPTTKKGKLPNLIIIQNESQSDFSNLKGLTLSSDPLAFQHSLKENTIHGHLNVSVFGGGTANTEYEVLTSNALSLLSNNVFPYQQLIHNRRHNITTLLENYGYQSVAMHPQSSLNYNRQNVYEDFGFSKSYFLDSKPSINSLYDARMERNFVSDSSLFEGLKNLLEKKGDAPLFTFLVTMQGHGSYNGSSYADPITVNGSAETYPDVSEFLSSLQSSDQAFKELVTFLESYEEPTIVLMYGDHQPSLNSGFYENYMPQNSGDKLVDYSMKYTTPFVIWANYDIPEKADTTISPNFLVPYMIDNLSQTSNPLPSSTYYRFLKEQQKQVPVMTTWGYQTPDGKYHETLDEDQLENYRIVEYYNVMEKQDQSRNTFFE